MVHAGVLEAGLIPPEPVHQRREQLEAEDQQNGQGAQHRQPDCGGQPPKSQVQEDPGQAAGEDEGGVVVVHVQRPPHHEEGQVVEAPAQV